MTELERAAAHQDGVRIAREHMQRSAAALWPVCRVCGIAAKPGVTCKRPQGATCPFNLAPITPK
jgi:hypothetical protein